MQNRVHDPADILVHRQPVAHQRRIERRLVVVRVRVAVEVPRRIDERIHRVRLAPRAAPPHFGHFTFTNSGTLASGDWPTPENFAIGGSTTGKSLSGTGTIPHFSQ